MDATRRLHGVTPSGHVHRVALLLRMLGLDYEFVEAPAAVRATPAFRALNPFGQIPVLEDAGLVLADSNAILVYLAKRYDRGGTWLPEEPAAAAAVQRWLSVAAGEVAYGPALARSAMHFGAPGDPAQARAVAARLLAVLEAHLEERPWLATAHPTIADLACASYLAVAPEGGIPLEPWPAVRAWLGRVAALPGYVAMPALPRPQASPERVPAA